MWIATKDLFITTKVWIDNYGYEQAKESVLKSMKKLKVDYLDLVLLHQPFSDYYGAYRALQELYKEDKIRAIGVSNFAPDRLTDMIAFNEIPPQVNQVEVNPLASADTSTGKHGKTSCPNGSVGTVWRGKKQYVP
ncbi:MAG: aldo/keto reductase [Sellimonas intestinalis]